MASSSLHPRAIGRKKNPTDPLGFIDIAPKHMSRGFPQQSGFGAREASSLPEGKAKRDALGILGKDEVARNNLSEFGKLLEAYSNNDLGKILFDSKEGKDGAPTMSASTATKLLKSNLVQALKKIPPAVRKVIEVDKSELDSLYRGVKKSSIAITPFFKNGEYVLSFSKDKDKAVEFAGSRGAIISSPDIASIQGIIDVRKLESLINDYNKANNLEGGVDSKGKPTKGRAIAKVKLGFKDEQEYIVYGVEFKGEKGVVDGRADYPWLD